MRGATCPADVVSDLVQLFARAGDEDHPSARSGDFLRRKYVLSGIYAARAVAIAVFLALPLTGFSALAFAAAMGFLWLGTVPLTSGLIGQIFGVRYLSTLYGITWTIMGIAGAIGPILMGRAFDQTGSYEALLLWLAIATLAAAALMLTLPVHTLRISKQPVSASVR